MNDYFFFVGRCVKAEPAAVLESFDVLPSERTFEAAVPAFLDVCSFDCFFVVAMRTPPAGKVGCGWSPRPRHWGNADRIRRTGFSPYLLFHAASLRGHVPTRTQSLLIKVDPS